ncbi:MAG: hypothetical protein HOU01_06930, partial [Streptomycetaceae bacterium]|nr:hypothetical protein [Streptomycetaceae bacterium]
MRRRRAPPRPATRSSRPLGFRRPTCFDSLGVYARRNPPCAARRVVRFPARCSAPHGPAVVPATARVHQRSGGFARSAHRPRRIRRIRVTSRPTPPRRRRSPRTLATAVAGALAVSPVLIAAHPAAAAPSPDVLVAEVYGGGGNAGATLTHDFVELVNKSAAAVDLTGWTVQYRSATAAAGTAWQATALTGSIAPGGRLLVAEAKGQNGTVALPTPDVAGSIAMSATAGTVAVAATADRLTCSTPDECAADTRIRDLVGYGNAAVREGSPATGASNSAALARDASSDDTDDNAADFAAGAPTPVNARGEVPGTPGGEPAPTARIHDIQGTTRVSPKNGAQVSAVPGIVTAIRPFGSSRGFWIQDPQPDDDPRTSEGLFVFTGNATPQGVAVGDAVTVSGKVEEYYPGSADA